MSLDSVALIVEFEKYFSIQIPDASAGKVSTVQDAVNCISRLRNVSDERPVLRDHVFTDLRKAISASGLSKCQVNQADLVSNVLPDTSSQTWKLISEALGLEIPLPSKNNPGTSWWSKIIPAFQFDYNQLTFSQLTDVICARNHGRLIDRNNISTSYEVYIAIMAITVDCTGIDFYEMSLEKTFAGDFGID